MKTLNRIGVRAQLYLFSAACATLVGVAALRKLRPDLQIER